MRDPICGMDLDNDEFTIDMGGRLFHFCSAGCLEKFKNPEGYAEEYVYDLAIVGAGPAGLTAGVYTSSYFGFELSFFLVNRHTTNWILYHGKKPLTHKMQ